MALADELGAAFYDLGDARAVVGLAKVVRAAFPDPSDAAGRFVAVELAPVRAPVVDNGF